jgi:hypothetical protein
MIIKRLLRPDRVRQVPESFSWVDHRLVRQNCLARCDCHAWALYFFITVVGDVQGLSFYCDASIARHLKLDLAQVAAARQQLLAAGLIAYQKPIYQVLALPQAPGGESSDLSTAPRSGQPQCAGDILRRVLTGGAA